MNQKEIRKAFWESFPQFKTEYKATKRQNKYSADIRLAFVDFVEHLRRDNQITEKQAYRVTL